MNMIFSHISFRWMVPAALAAGLLGCATGGIQAPSGKPVTDTMAVFQRGGARMTCELSCSYASGAASRDIHRLYEQGLWIDLVNEVARVGYKNDLSYFFLGRAAEELGYAKAAKIYYKLALATNMKCDGVINVCYGIDVNRYINGYFKKLDQQATQLADSTPPSNHISSATPASGNAAENRDPQRQDTAASTDNRASDGEVPPITVEMWRLMTGRPSGLSSDWLLKKNKTLLAQSAALRAKGESVSSLIKSAQASVLLDYYIELENFPDADEMRAKMAQARVPLRRFGLDQNFFDKSLRNLKAVLPEGAILSSKHTSGTVFGHRLGAKFTLPECPRNNLNIPELPYKTYVDKTCIEYIIVRDPPAPYHTGNVKIRFPIDDIPEGVHGINYWVFLINGQLESVSFETGGIENMDYVYELLKRKYGQPKKATIRTVRNLYGATFEVVDAKWAQDNIFVNFTGVNNTINSGSVEIMTKNLIVYRRTKSNKLSKPTSL